MKRSVSVSLIAQISVLVVVIESVGFTALGLYYNQRFAREIDQRLEAQVRLPGILMNQQLLRYESIADQAMMTELVGGTLVDGLVVDAKQHVFYALHPDAVGKQVTDLPDLHPEWFNLTQNTPTIVALTEAHAHFLICVTPLVAYPGGNPYFFVYIKVNTTQSETEKMAIFWSFLLGAAASVAITSLALIVSMQNRVTQPLRVLEGNACQFAHGHLAQAMPIARQDEIGRLAQSFLEMRDAIQQKISQLEEFNQTLEQKVAERTQDLARHVNLLQQEIVERQRMEEALQQRETLYRQMFQEHSAIKLLIEPESGAIVEANLAASEFYGYPQDVLQQMNIAQINTLPPEQIAQERRSAQARQRNYFMFPHRLASGEVREVEVHTAPIQVNNRTLLYSIIHDITERKRLEVELIAAKNAAEASNRAKSMFLANMSHELRTPLNAVIGFSQIVAHGQNLTPEQHDNLRTINRSGEHLLTLINQVLDLSKIEAGRITLDVADMDVHRLLDELADLFRLRAREKGLSLVFERQPAVPRHVRADAVKLRQVLLNLLGNALKFTQTGRVIVRVKNEKCRVKSEECRVKNEKCKVQSEECKVKNEKWTVKSEEGNVESEEITDTFHSPLCTFHSSLFTLHFEVEDTGPGIAPEELAHLFEAFVQTATGRQSQEGTGLGLAISRKFVQLMGGDITVHSVLNHGSTFAFTIPYDLSAAADQPAASGMRQVIGLEAGQPRYRLLIVDDQRDNRQLLVTLLNDIGFDLREAANGQEAIEMWKTWMPHLIWMDIRMPVMNGYDASKRIKQTAQGQSTAIIALTASAFEEERAIVLAAGCDDFVRKPFHETEIFEMMQKHLGVRYVYADEQPAPPAADRFVLDPAALADLPDDIKDGFCQAINELDMELAYAMIARIRPLDAPLADALTELVDNYRFDTLLAMFTPREHGAEAIPTI